jgi:chemotaxis protein CheC
MAAAILSVPAIEFGKMADGVLLIDTVFETKESNAEGFFFLVPDFESFGVILSALGVG